jgi:hypothetical protein
VRDRIEPRAHDPDGGPDRAHGELGRKKSSSS